MTKTLKILPVVVLSVLLLLSLYLTFLRDAEARMNTNACDPVSQASKLDNPIPQAKSDLEISRTLPESRLIVFQATTLALAEPLAEFGDMHSYHTRPYEYWLTVDAFYDFEEVVAYIENYQPEE